MQSRIVSALLIGGPGGILVPRGRDVGGTFLHLPLSPRGHADRLRRGVFIISRHRAADGDHALRAVGRLDTRRGVHQSRGARRRRGRPQRLFRRGRKNCPAVRARSDPWTVGGRPIATPMVRVVGLLKGQCRSNAFASYLEVSVRAWSWQSGEP